MNRFLNHRTASIVASLALAALAACSTSVPSDLDLSLSHRSNHGAYLVSLQPPSPAPAINQMHAWQVRVSAADGSPVRQARLRIDGGMPQHGHGLPTRPQVTSEIAEGIYLLEGMKFSMPGWWEIRLAIQGPAGDDAVTFNTLVRDPASRL
jgi:hypothetical protein